ncbi:ATP-binding protein [Vibrio furnissii]
MRTVSRFSIKARLMLLCLMPMLVIGWGTWNLFSQFQTQLVAYRVITKKIDALNHLTNATHLAYDMLIGRIHQNDVQRLRIALDNELTLVGANIDEQNLMRVSGNSASLSSSNVAELKSLASEIASATVAETHEYGTWTFDLIYELLTDIQKRSNHEAPTDIHTLDVVYDDLSWFLYWMQREAWFIRDLSQTDTLTPQQLGQYFQIAEREQQHLERFIDTGASSVQLDQIVKLFAQQDFRQGAILRDKILRQEVTPSELSGYVQTLENRQAAVQKLFLGFSEHLSQQIDQQVRQESQRIAVISAVVAVVFVLLLVLGLGTFYRISSKLNRILATMGQLRDKRDSVKQIAIDGNDEFSDFVGSLNHIILELKAHEERLIHAKEEAIAANRAKSSFLANMSHEIRTPLNGIIGMTEILASSGLNVNQQDILDDIDTSSQSLLILLNDILDLSKIEAGSLTLNPNAFNFAEMVYDTVNLVNVKAISQHIELAIQLDPELPVMVVADEYRVKQILMNLLSNAVKFTQDGYVNVEVNYVSQDTPLIRCSVTDTGKGIDKDKLSTIFDPFTQEDGSITRRFGGTGLGLAICRQLLELMDGSIQVHSTKDLGSQFEFTVPVTLPLEQPTPQPLNQTTLFISNNSNYSAAIRRECTRLGLTVVEASTIAHIEDASVNQVVNVLYCHSLTHGKLSDIDDLKQRFPYARLIMLQHHLFTNKAVADAIHGRITLPFLGLRFEKLLRESSPSALLSPVQDARHPRPAQEEEEATNPRILIVEDNLMNQKIATFFLEKAGLAYVIVSNGQEAVDIVTQGGQFSAVLMDCMMPVMDGFTATRKIREWESAQGLKNIPIIALTASVLDEDIAHCFEAGMDAYLPKPYKSKQLFDIFTELEVA